MGATTLPGLWRLGADAPRTEEGTGMSYFDLRGYVPPQSKAQSARDVLALLACITFGALFMVGCLLTVGGS